MKNNVLFRAIHLPGRENILADCLSRQQVKQAHQLYPELNKVPVDVPLTWTLCRILLDFLLEMLFFKARNISIGRSF